MSYKDPAKQKAAQAKHYLNNKALYQKRAKDRKIKQRALIIEAKSKPCADCGIEYPYYVMQFDHIGDDKEFGIGSQWYRKGVAAIKAEIAKCQVVCSNCHAIRTWNRIQG